MNCVSQGDRMAGVREWWWCMNLCLPPAQTGGQRLFTICRSGTVTDNGLKLTALPGFLLLFRSLPLTPPPSSH